MTLAELITALQAIPDKSLSVKIADADTNWFLDVEEVTLETQGKSTFVVLDGSYSTVTLSETDSYTLKRLELDALAAKVRAWMESLNKEEVKALRIKYPKCTVREAYFAEHLEEKK